MARSGSTVPGRAPKEYRCAGTIGGAPRPGDAVSRVRRRPGNHRGPVPWEPALDARSGVGQQIVATTVPVPGWPGFVL